MNTTPLWVPLVVAGIGLAGTLVGTVAGVLLTQRKSDRRDQVTWDRERERERERWDREDALRTFEQRRDAYVSFYDSLRAMARTAYDHGLGFSTPPAATDEGWELPFEWNQEAFHKVQQLRVYASPIVLQAADWAYSTCWAWGHHTRWSRDDDGFYERQKVYGAAELAFYDAIRRDLGVPGAELHAGLLSGSGWAASDAESDGPASTP